MTKIVTCLAGALSIAVGLHGADSVEQTLLAVKEVRSLARTGSPIGDIDSPHAVTSPMESPRLEEATGPRPLAPEEFVQLFFKGEVTSQEIEEAFNKSAHSLCFLQTMYYDVFEAAKKWASYDIFTEKAGRWYCIILARSAAFLPSEHVNVYAGVLPPAARSDFLKMLEGCCREGIESAHRQPQEKFRKLATRERMRKQVVALQLYIASYTLLAGDEYPEKCEEFNDALVAIRALLPPVMTR